MAELNIDTKEWVLPNGKTARLRTANPSDMETVRALYFNTYGEHYTIEEISNAEQTIRALSNKNNYLWIVTECEGEIIGSVIFTVDPYHRLGKAFSGVIKPDFRGNKIIYSMMEEGHKCLLKENGPCDLIYAVVRTLASPHFHENLQKLGYIDSGIFPNVRKVMEYETHSFKVCLGPHALLKRRQLPRVYNKCMELYRLAARSFNLGECIAKQIDLGKPSNDYIELAPISSEEFPAGIEAERERLRQERRLRFGFYPLHAPNLLLADKDRTIKAFLYYHETDGHASLVGLETGTAEMPVLLESIAKAAEKLGAKYLEALASAYDPLIQAQLWQADFIPSAWFPSARLSDEDGKREDYLAVSRSFVPMHFKGLKLTKESKPYLLEYYKAYSDRLWEELSDA
ncbi:MAG: hypothetical protein K6G50_03180 [bacterium]|nr:hypothetical protein [bacterium]